MEKDFKWQQPSNPTDEERHEMLRILLERAGRIEDLNNIITLLSPPEEITKLAPKGIGANFKVGIIGAGVAGLASAFELRKLGFNITIFDIEEKRIGGRIYTHYFDKDKNCYGEFGAMRIPVSHETTWHYINLLGIKMNTFIQNDENGFLYIRDIRVRNDDEGKNVMEKIYPYFHLTPREKETPWQKLLDYGLNSALTNMKPEVRRELMEIKKKYSYEIEYYDTLNIRQVLQKMRLSQPCIDLLGEVSPFLNSFYYNSYSEHLQEEYTINFGYMYSIDGGAVNFPIAFYNSLISKNPKEYDNVEINDLGIVSFKQGKRVTGIYEDSNKNKVILQYIDKKLKETWEEAFDFVICTIPFSSLRNVTICPLFTSEKMQSIKEVNYNDTQKTLFMCNERFWEKGNKKERIIGGGSFTDLPITSIWYTSQQMESMNCEKHGKKNKGDSWKGPGVLLASYNFNQDAIRLGNLEHRLRFNNIKRQIEAVHGIPTGYLDNVVEDFKTIQWGREEGFSGGFCQFLPNQKNIFLYHMVKPEYNNKVYFAGEHVSTNHGWIQGSLNSAMKAANELAEHCKNLIYNKC